MVDAAGNLLSDAQLAAAVAAAAATGADAGAGITSTSSATASSGVGADMHPPRAGVLPPHSPSSQRDSAVHTSVVMAASHGSSALACSPADGGGATFAALAETTHSEAVPGDARSMVHKCADVLVALREAGLLAKRVRSLSRRMWLLKIKAPEWRLEQEAERIRLRMRRKDGGWSRFKRSMRGAFAASLGCGDDEDGRSLWLTERAALGAPSLFHSSDRQTLIDRILRSSTHEGGAHLGEGSPLGMFVSHMFPLHMNARLQELRNDWLAIWRPLKSVAERDRVGVVDAAWYAETKLVTLTDTANEVAASPFSMQAAYAQRGGGVGRVLSATRWLSGGAPKHGSAPASANAAPSTCCCTGCGDCGTCCCAGTRSACTACMRCAPAPLRMCARGALRLVSCWCKCGRSVGRCGSRVFTQPLDRIAAYFGETVAFYFAWLQFYTQWLVPPAAAGLLLFVGQVYEGTLDTAYVPLFSLFMAVWSILFLEFWKRRNATLAQRWGALGYEDEEVVRPQFVGTWKQDASTGAIVRVYPTWRRAAKYAVSIPAMLACVAAIFFIMIMVFSTRDHLLHGLELHEAALRARADAVAAMIAAGNATSVDALPPVPPYSINVLGAVVDAWNTGIVAFLRGVSNGDFSGGGGSGADTPAPVPVPTTPAPPLDGGQDDNTAASLSWSSILASFSRFEQFFNGQHDWKWWTVTAVPPIVYGLLMLASNVLFGRVALFFNDWENHATESSYRNHRIAKVFFFRFLASFVSLFYYAFSPLHSLTTLFMQLAAFLVVGQLVNNLMEVGGAGFWKLCSRCRARARVRHAEDSGLAEGRRGRRLLRHAQSQAWEEARARRYDTFDDYAELLIQYGQVTFFSWAFPLAPLCALINNLFEMRTDAYRLLYLTQRPIAYKAGGIGVWHNVLSSMSILAVLTNCAHLALTSKQFRDFFPALTDAQRLLLVFVFEHMVLALRLMMMYIIPPVPAAVKRRAARDMWALARLQGRRSIGEGTVITLGQGVIADLSSVPLSKMS